MNDRFNLYAGDIVLFTAGEYSDYRVEEVYRVLQDFNLQTQNPLGYRSEEEVERIFNETEIPEYAERLAELEELWQNAHADDPYEPRQYRTQRHYRALIDQTIEDRDIYCKPRLREFDQNLFLHELTRLGYLQRIEARYMHREDYNAPDWAE